MIHRHRTTARFMAGRPTIPGIPESQQIVGQWHDAQEEVVKSCIAEMARMHPDNYEHRRAAAALDAVLAQMAADTARTTGKAIERATYVLAVATVGLLFATLALVWVTAHP